MTTYVLHVDPKGKGITSVACTGTIYDHLKEHFPTGFDHVNLGRIREGAATLSMWVDDEGLFREPQSYFALRGYATPLAGLGIVCVTDYAGESVGLSPDEGITVSAALARAVDWLGEDLEGAIGRGRVERPAVIIREGPGALSGGGRVVSEDHWPFRPRRGERS